jgi:ABC-type branched-subunit amino acid transport system substrate-binding protein
MKWPSLLLLPLCALLAACPTRVDQSGIPPVNPDAVVIGMLQPLASGSSLEKEQAARLAVAEINAAGGVNGQPLDIRVMYDNNNSPAAGVPAAQALVDSGVVAIIGANASAVTIPVAQQVTIPANIALISPGSTSPLISTLADNNTVFRIPPSDALQGRLLAEKVWGEGHTSVAIFGLDEPYGNGLADAFSQRFVALGGSIQATVLAPAGKNSGYSSEIASLYAAGTPSALMAFSFSQQTASLLREIVTAKGSLPMLYGVDANMIQDTLNNAPPQIAGMRGSTPGADPTTPPYQHFLHAFTAATGYAPAANTENAYDAVYLIALAMQAAGQNNRAAVLARLSEVSRPDTASPVVIVPGGFAQAITALQGGADIDYQGASGRIDFDANGDPAAATYQYLEVQPTPAGLRLITLETVNY